MAYFTDKWGKGTFVLGLALILYIIAVFGMTPESGDVDFHSDHHYQWNNATSSVTACYTTADKGEVDRIDTTLNIGYYVAVAGFALVVFLFTWAGAVAESNGFALTVASLSVLFLVNTVTVLCYAIGLHFMSSAGRVDDSDVLPSSMRICDATVGNVWIKTIIGLCLAGFSWVLQIAAFFIGRAGRSNGI